MSKERYVGTILGIILGGAFSISFIINASSIFFGDVARFIVLASDAVLHGDVKGHFETWLSYYIGDYEDDDLVFLEVWQ